MSADATSQHQPVTARESAEKMRAAHKDTLWRRAWRQLRRNRLAMACLAVLLIYTAVWAVTECIYWTPRIADWADEQMGSGLPAGMSKWLRGIADVKASYSRSDYDNRNVHSTLLPSTPIPPKPTTGDWARRADWQWKFKQRLSHPLGTDFAGRDNLLRTFQGCRIAFELALLVSLIAIPLGFTLGALAGFFGGWVDDVIVYVYSVFASVPDILLIIAITYVGQQIPVISKFYLLPLALGMGLTGWVGLCRLIRGEFLKHRESTYVLAARSLGASNTSLMFKHVAPNTLHLVVINFTLRFPGLVMTEAVLAYLGIGIQTEPSWGAVINDARQRLWLGNWWEIGGVTVAMFFLVLALNLFGDALRDALDPKLRTAEAG